jgi:hypothetical protein
MESIPSMPVDIARAHFSPLKLKPASDTQSTQQNKRNHPQTHTEIGSKKSKPTAGHGNKEQSFYLPSISQVSAQRKAMH